MFPRVWSSLFTVNIAAFVTLVSTSLTILKFSTTSNTWWRRLSMVVKTKHVLKLINCCHSLFFPVVQQKRLECWRSVHFDCRSISITTSLMLLAKNNKWNSSNPQRVRPVFTRQNENEDFKLTKNNGRLNSNIWKVGAHNNL